MNIYRVKVGNPPINTFLISARSVEEAAKKARAKSRKIGFELGDGEVTGVELVGALD